MQAFFMENLNKPKISARASSPTQWQAAREVISVLQDASLVSTQVQGGRHGFVGMAINSSSYVLLKSLSDSTQDIVSLDPFDGDPEEVVVTDLLPKVQKLLEILVDDMGSRGLASAEKPTEKIYMPDARSAFQVLLPRCLLQRGAQPAAGCSQRGAGEVGGILRHCICERGCRRNGECFGGLFAGFSRGGTGGGTGCEPLCGRR
ncbi:unnamed protein product [Pylaiella littoralis]